MLSIKDKPIYLIFFIEMWERFGFYGLQSVITSYMIKRMLISEGHAISLFSAFTAIVYGFVAIGGWLGDKFLGTKRTIILGLIFLILGYAIISFCYVHKNLIYLGLSTIAIGNCLFKANPTTLLSMCSKKSNKTVETIFTMYYMSINIGSFISMMITPILISYFSWKFAFLLSVVILTLNLFIFIKYKYLLKDYGSEADFLPLRIDRLILSVLISISLIFAFTWALKNYYIINKVLSIIFTITFLIFIKNIFVCKGFERKKMIVAFTLILEAICFFILYNQMPTSLNFFSKKNLIHKIFGINLAGEQFQAFNPFWIIILCPIITKFYKKLGKIFPVTHKFVIGMFLCSFSFFIINLGIHFNINKTGLISGEWFLFSSLLQSLGELMISGLGLSMISQLVPKNLMGFIMGTWFLTTSVATLISGNIASIFSLNIKKNVSTLLSLILYNNFFMKMSLFSSITATLMFFIAPYLNKIIIKNKEISNNNNKKK